jgi:hypothetical protein
VILLLSPVSSTGACQIKTMKGRGFALLFMIGRDRIGGLWLCPLMSGVCVLCKGWRLKAGFQHGDGLCRGVSSCAPHKVAWAERSGYHIGSGAAVRLFSTEVRLNALDACTQATEWLFCVHGLDGCGRRLGAHSCVGGNPGSVRLVRFVITPERFGQPPPLGCVLPDRTARDTGAEMSRQWTVGRRAHTLP